MKRPDYQPGQKVITFVGKGFDQPTPRLAWCITGAGCIKCSDNHFEIIVSYHENEIELSYGADVRAEKVKPYTPQLWAACQDWIKRREQLAADLETLTRQRIPQTSGKPIRAPWQDLLFKSVEVQP